MGDTIRTQKINLDTFHAIMQDDSGNIYLPEDEEVSSDTVDLSDTTRIDPRQIRHQFSVYADSHPGFLRKSNEDSYAFYSNVKRHSVMAVVADGIGGHENGDIASNLTVKMLLGAWREFQMQDLDTEKVSVFLLNELEEINQAVYSINAEYNVAYPMGTTVAAAVVLPRSIVTAHAGDSRIYRLRGKVLERLTQDHSYVNELIRNGTLTEAEAATHPYAHVISKSIGPLSALNPEISVYDRLPGDRMLVCSDGLNLHLSDDEIRAVMYTASTPRNAVKKMLNTALRKGGGDNTTMICVFD